MLQINEQFYWPLTGIKKKGPKARSLGAKVTKRNTTSTTRETVAAFPAAKKKKLISVATVLFSLVSFPGLFRVSRDIMSHA